MLNIIIGLIIGSVIGVVLMCIMTTSHRQSEIEDPSRRKASKPVNEKAATLSIWDIATYIAECLDEKDVTTNNITNLLFLCQAHYLAWTNTLLFPVYFFKYNDTAELCDFEFAYSLDNVPENMSLREYLLNHGGKSENLSQSVKTDIELAIARHIHSDLSIIVKENPTIMSTENNEIISYRLLRNDYRIENESEQISLTHQINNQNKTDTEKQTNTDTNE